VGLFAPKRRRRSRDREFDVVVALTYYHPYVSGLTVVAKVLAERLAADGYRVAVVTTKHSPDLPTDEVIGGVEVHRCPIFARIGKGTLSHNFPTVAARFARRASLLHLHLPLLEAGAIAALAGSTPVITTYHCDLALPRSLFNAVQRTVVDASNRLAFRRSRLVVFSTEDYARTSRVRRAAGVRTMAIPPPCTVRPQGSPRFREGDGFHVGFLGRIVEEKGLDYLLDGFAVLSDPDARLLIAGALDVAGGSIIDQLRDKIERDDRVRLLGFIDEDQLADFYASLDAFALTSVNSFEAFGIVQAEALMAGVPVVTTDLPGVRMPVQSLDFGEIVPPRDAKSIAAALERLADADTRDAASAATRARELYGAGSVYRTYREAMIRIGLSNEVATPRRQDREIVVAGVW
jgi:glycosyltransferase involved in cell wall biosynthesis